MRVVMEEETHERQQIAAVLEQYRRGFATAERADLTAIWDQDYDPIIYIALERAEPLRGWAAVGMLQLPF
jgi:hypothetical protein